MTKLVNSKNKVKLLSIGTRVAHKHDKNLNEGVVVWVYNKEHNVYPKYANKIYLVFWSNNKRGIYAPHEIQKNNIKFTQFISEEKEDNI